MSLQRRFTAYQGALLVVDIQEKLIAKIRQGPLVLSNAARLIQAAKALGVPVWGTEQYPQGLGATDPELKPMLPVWFTKTAFSCCAVHELIEQFHGRGIAHVTLTGIEAHVCVSQTALDLLAMGITPIVPADAVASRFEGDWHFALRRLERAGAVITTTEAVLFEWAEDSQVECFKTISKLVRDHQPPSGVSLPADRTIGESG